MIRLLINILKRIYSFIWQSLNDKTCLQEAWKLVDSEYLRLHDLKYQIPTARGIKFQAASS